MATKLRNYPKAREVERLPKAPIQQDEYGGLLRSIPMKVYQTRHLAREIIY